MVTAIHETLHSLFRDDPEFAVRSLRELLHVQIPETVKFDTEDTNLTTVEPLERRVDSLLRVQTAEGDFLLAIEAQRKRDESKTNSWAYYMAYLYAKHKVPPLLLVLCHDRTTAEWAMRPVKVGFAGHTSLGAQPLVIGPDQVPVFEDAKEAERDPVMASFSAILHRDDRNAAAILEVLATALEQTSSQQATDCMELTEAGLMGSPALEIWRKLMLNMDVSQYHGVAATRLRAAGREEGLEEGREAGREEGLVKALLLLIENREMTLTDDERERIASCSDPDRLETWIARAAVAQDIGSVFAD